MKKPFNNDGTPRKVRSDCKFFALPVPGKDEFLAVVTANRANPNVEQLQAVCAKHGVEWSTKGIYDFLRSDRLTEQLISGEVRSNIRLGAELADAGSKKLHGAARDLATAHYATIVRIQKNVLMNPDATAEQKALAEIQIAEATKMLVDLGYAEGGAQAQLLKEAKYKLDIEKQKLAREKFETDACALALKHAATLKGIATNKSLDETGRINAARQLLFGELPQEATT